jgi:ABC-type glycerol-3-phosphate transport system substrate-binding protein
VLKRKNYWLLFAILLLSLTSLSPSMELSTDDGPYLRSSLENQSARPSSGEEGTIDRLRVTVSLSDEEFQELELISARYTLSSGVVVELNNRNSEGAYDTILKELTIGDSPDIIMTDGRNILDLATRGYLLPVNVYQTTTPGSTPLTSLIPLLQWNGYDWGVPLDIDPYVLVYSPSRLAEMGMEKLPGSLEEWNSLLQNVRKVKGKSLLALDTRNPYGYSLLLESMGSHLLSEDTEPLIWTQEARGNFYLTSRYNEEIWGMLGEGTLAAAAIPLSEWQSHGNAGLKAEVPLGKGNGRGMEAVESRCFALSAQSLHPEEAVNWLSYITSRSAGLEWLEATGRLPALDELYRAGLPGTEQLPFKTELLLAEDNTRVEQTPGVWSAVSTASASLLTGKIDAAGYQQAIIPGNAGGREEDAASE